MSCTIPAKIITIDGSTATVDVYGTVGFADISLLNDAGIGDYIILYAGRGIDKVAEKDALEIISYLTEVNRRRRKA